MPDRKDFHKKILSLGVNSEENEQANFLRSFPIADEPVVRLLSGLEHRKYSIFRWSIFYGTPDRIRTYDLWLRKPTLYPAELRVQVWIFSRDFAIGTTDIHLTMKMSIA